MKLFVDTTANNSFAAFHLLRLWNCITNLTSVWFACLITFEWLHVHMKDLQNVCEMNCGLSGELHVKPHFFTCMGTKKWARLSYTIILSYDSCLQSKYKCQMFRSFGKVRAEKKHQPKKPFARLKWERIWHQEINFFSIYLKINFHCDFFWAHGHISIEVQITFISTKDTKNSSASNFNVLGGFM